MCLCLCLFEFIMNIKCKSKSTEHEGIDDLNILIFFNEPHIYVKVKSPGRPSIFERNGGARGVIVIVVGNGHGDTSSNPVRG